MQPDDQIPRDKDKAGWSGNPLDLFYFQQRGGHRYYLRVTPLGAFLIIFLVLLSVGMILYLASTKTPPPNVNTNITVPSPTPYLPDKAIIRQPPPPSPPKPTRSASQPLVAPTPPKIEYSSNSNAANSATYPE